MNVWTREFCLKVLTMVSERGFHATAKDLRYSTESIFRSSLCNYVKKFGLLTEYKRTLDDVRKRKNKVIKKEVPCIQWTEDDLDKIFEKAVERKGFDKVYQDYGYTDVHTFIYDIHRAAIDLGIRYKINSTFRQMWDKRMCVEIIDYIKTKGRPAAMEKYLCVPYSAFYQNLKYVASKYGIESLCDDDRVKPRRFDYDKELCEQVIREIRESGVDIVARKYGYIMGSGGFLSKLYEGSTICGVVSNYDEFKKLIGK